jgi:DNA sulfur modification protein DndB
MQAQMGRWRYYVVKMTMREVAESVRFASDVYNDFTLDEAIQRILNESRVRKEIVTYLVRQEDRFFNSLVVAAIGGDPMWYPVAIEDDERFLLLREDKRINTTFGILRFTGNQKYYALDGQHRLAAIKALVDPKSDVARNAPEGFSEEEISVVIVVPDEADTDAEFRKRYRRLFGNLNRYAKATDQVDNIIMDEDDVFAIITRRLITDHPFFKAAGPQRESHRVKMKKGKNLTRQDSYFTSLETLYDINKKLLASRSRRTSGWGDEGVDMREFMRFRPAEEMIEDLYRELVLYWDGLLSAVPELKNDPPRMRNHDATDDEEEQDHLLFWPIGQDLAADVARDALDMLQDDPETPSEESVRKALKGLGSLTWELHRPPWRNLLLIPDGSGSWKMRNEERKAALAVGGRILRWKLGVHELDDDAVAELRRDWAEKLLPALAAAEVDSMWQSVVGD